jgi:hypothetical protein
MFIGNRAFGFGDVLSSVSLAGIPRAAWIAFAVVRAFAGSHLDKLAAVHTARH